MAAVTEWHVFNQSGSLTSIRYDAPPHRQYVVNNNLTVREVLSRAVKPDELPELPITKGPLK